MRKPRVTSDRAPRNDRSDALEKPKPQTFGMRAERNIGTPGVAEEGERIARVIARAGLCSRRDAEEWIEAGRVAVNGKVITSPALDITAKDRVSVDGAPLPEREATRLWLYHKPRGLVTTAEDPEGRPTVFDNLPSNLPRVVSIGRLDINTEGLMLLTNDGGLARVLAHPETGWLRRYRVRVYGSLDQAMLDTLREGITLDGVHYGPILATLDREMGDNAWLTMDLREGKNREIKRVLEYLGCQVSRLIRVSFGPFQLGEIAEGEVDEVRPRVLRDQLGTDLAEEAGVYFDGPRVRVAVEAEPDERPKRFDRRKPTEKRDMAIMGEDASLRVERETVADRRGRAVKVERVTRLPDDELPRAPRDEVRREDRPYRSASSQAFGERPVRAERPARARDDGDMRPPRKPRFGTGEREERPRFSSPRDEGRMGDRPFGKTALRGERPVGDRAQRGDRPTGDRPFRAGPRPDGDRPPRGDRPDRGDRPVGDRPPRGDRRYGDRAPRDERPAGDRPFRAGPRPDGDRPPRGDRPARNDRPFGDRPSRGDRPEGDRPFRAGPRGDGPRSGGPGRDSPRRDGPSRGGRPTGPGGKPGGAPRRSPRRDT
ncbi:Pseudouridine synthase, RsuA/RluB/E/F [Rhabdaerophilaceae bacterium]